VSVLAIIGLGLILWGVVDLFIALGHFLRALWILITELIPALVMWLIDR
jgi:hypothetical protein